LFIYIESTGLMSTNNAYKISFLFVSFLFWMSITLYVPTLPTYIKTLTDDLSTVGLILSLFGLCMALIRLPMGLAGDRIGWGKPIIGFGIFLATLGAYIMGRGNSLGMIAAGRALAGFSAGTWVLLIGVFSTFFDFDQAVLASSMINFSASFSRMISTGLTGYLNRLGGYSLSYYLASCAGLLAIIILIFIREERRPPEPVSLKSIRTLLRRKDILFPALISIVMHHADYAVTFGFLPIRAQQMGADDVVKGMLLCTNIASVTAANLFGALFLKNARPQSVLYVAAPFFSAGILITAAGSSRWTLFAGTAVMGFSFGLIYPVLIGRTIRDIDRSQRITAIGIHQTLYSIGSFTGPWLGGILADLLGIRVMFMATALACLPLVYLCTHILIRENAV